MHAVAGRHKHEETSCNDVSAVAMPAARGQLGIPVVAPWSPPVPCAKHRDEASNATYMGLFRTHDRTEAAHMIFMQAAEGLRLAKSCSIFPSWAWDIHSSEGAVWMDDCLKPDVDARWIGAAATLLTHVSSSPGYTWCAEAMYRAVQGPRRCSPPRHQLLPPRPLAASVNTVPATTQQQLSACTATHRPRGWPAYEHLPRTVHMRRPPSRRRAPVTCHSRRQPPLICHATCTARI